MQRSPYTDKSDPSGALRLSVLSNALSGSFYDGPQEILHAGATGSSAVERTTHFLSVAAMRRVASRCEASN